MIKKKERNSFNFIIIFFLFTILLGCFFRFINLGNKIVWHDEALTISRVSGYYAKEINREIFNGQIIPLSTLKKFQERKPNSKDFNIINILATDNPQHPPIYYLLLRFWSNIWGSSPGSFRYLSAFFGVLILPLTYWLCRELEQSFLTNLLATVLVAVSPIFVLYAQEAREYSLWIVSILISAIALLRAVKKKNVLNSGTINISKNITWNKGESYFLVEAAKIINQAENPLIITNSQGLNFGNILALSHLLKKESNFLLVDGWQKADYQTNPEIPQKFNNIFLISVSEEFKELVKKQRNNSSIENVHYNDQFNLEKVFYD